MPDILPHFGLYCALVRRRAARYVDAGVQLSRITEASLKTLLPDAADEIWALWREGYVLPQEGLGYAVLREIPAAAGHLEIVPFDLFSSR